MSSLVTAASVVAVSPTYDEKLTREQALAHPNLPLSWSIVGLLLVEDASVHKHVYGG